MHPQVENENRKGRNPQVKSIHGLSPSRWGASDPFMEQWERELETRMRRRIHEILDLDRSPVFGGVKLLP